MKKGFTLIELLISVAITIIIAGAAYFSLNTALESWQYTKDQLALQKVLGEVSAAITGTGGRGFGLRDSLEILRAEKTRVDFVPPWTDDTHVVAVPGFIYSLNVAIKPGTGDPVVEVKSSGGKKRFFTNSCVVRKEWPPNSEVCLVRNVTRGRKIFFTYHPDRKSSPGSVETISWNPEDGGVVLRYKGEDNYISENPFGVVISKMEFKFYDNANKLISESGLVDTEDLNRVTGVEVLVEAALGQYRSSVLNFVSLRNSPVRSGYFLLNEGASFPVPDSHGIHSLVLKNIEGVSGGDALWIKVTPVSGKAWRVKIFFSRTGLDRGKIDHYAIEYPLDEEIYNEYLGTEVSMGLDLLKLGPNGKYDYDYDGKDVGDIVIIEGPAVLEVEKMDIEAAGIHARPETGVVL